MFAVVYWGWYKIYGEREREEVGFSKVVPGEATKQVKTAEMVKLSRSTSST